MVYIYIFFPVHLTQFLTNSPIPNSLKSSRTSPMDPQGFAGFNKKSWGKGLSRFYLQL